MSHAREGYHYEEVQQVSQELDTEIAEAQQQIERCNEFKSTLSEIDDTIAHYDSIACGSLQVDKDEQKIKATISAPEIGKKLRNLHQKYEWDSIEFDHL